MNYRRSTFGRNLTFFIEMNQLEWEFLLKLFFLILILILINFFLN